MNMNALSVYRWSIFLIFIVKENITNIELITILIAISVMRVGIISLRTKILFKKEKVLTKVFTLLTL